METLKKVLPFAIGQFDHTDPGQEPLSGSQGEGTADHPYDRGNEGGNTDLADEAPQHPYAREELPDPASKEKQTSYTLDSHVASSLQTSTNISATESKDENDASKPALSKKPTIGSPSWFTEDVERGQSAASEARQTVETKSLGIPAAAASEESSPALAKKHTIGSPEWFSENDHPFARKDSASGADNELDGAPKADLHIERQANVPTEKSVQGSVHLLPNQLGEDVPPGADSIVVEPSISSSLEFVVDTTDLSDQPNHLGGDVRSSLPAIITDKGKGKARAIEPEELSSGTSNRSDATREESIMTDTAQTRRTYSTAGTCASSLSSRRQSVIQQSGRIPTAGGVPLGARAAADRQHRLDSLIPENEATSSSSKLPWDYIETNDAMSSTQRSSRVILPEQIKSTLADPAPPNNNSQEEPKLKRRFTKKVKDLRKSISKKL